MAARKPVADAPPLPTRAQWTEWLNSQTAANPQFVPPVQVCVEDIAAWKDLKRDKDSLAFQEVTARKRICGFFFPAPEEGTNKIKLADGSVLNLSHQIKRDVDQPMLEALSKMKVSDFGIPKLALMGVDVNGLTGDEYLAHVMHIDLSKLIEWKPALAVKEWRTLTEAQHAIFDSILTFKDPETPQVKLEPPKGKDATIDPQGEENA